MSLRFFSAVSQTLPEPIWFRPGEYSATAEQKAHRLGAGPVGVQEYSANRGGHRLGPRLTHATHRHAQMLGLYHYDNAPGLEDVHQRIGDLAGHPFLDLGAAGVDVHQPGQLGQPGDLALLVRYIADVGKPEKRRQVMLA